MKRKKAIRSSFSAERTQGKKRDCQGITVEILRAKYNRLDYFLVVVTV